MSYLHGLNSPSSQLVGRVPPKVVPEPQSVDPFGININNGLLDMGLGTGGFKFGFDSDTFKDALDAASSVIGRAGVSIGQT